MDSTILIPSALARHTGGQTSVNTSEPSLGKALSALTEQFSLGEAVLTQSGDIQPYIRVVINNSMVSKAALRQPESIEIAGASVELKTAFAGG